MVARAPIPDWPAGSGVSDIILLSSRDGLNWDRTFREAFLRPVPDPNTWHERALHMEHGILQRGIGPGQRPPSGQTASGLTGSA